MDTMTAPMNNSPELREVRKGTIRLVIADDHPIVRDGLKKLLLLEDDFDIVGEAGDGRERSPLSTREREIVGLVAQGYKNKEMAEKMFISEQTVKNHLHNIFDKLGVSDRLELALYAIHKGLHLTGEAPIR